VHQELHALFEEDQADRRGELPVDLHRRDERRRRRVEQLLAQGAVTDPDDLFGAAMVFQHGADRAHYRRAEEMTCDDRPTPRRGEGPQVPGGGR
jgi:uncharacterized protein YhaN